MHDSQEEYMMKQVFKRISALVVTLCMLLGCVGGAMAQAQDGADLEPLYPLMDLYAPPRWKRRATRNTRL